MNETKQLVNFLIEAGKLGNVERKLHAIGSTRRENVAEHTYHMIFTAVLLLENHLTAEELIEVIKIILVHDLGEIGAGDLPFNKKTPQQVDAEETCYTQLVKLLPLGKQEEYLGLWHKYKSVSKETPLSNLALYAKSIDKLQSQIVCYSQVLNNPNYQYINNSTSEEVERLIWSYIRKVFGQQFEFMANQIKISAENNNKKN